MNFLKVEMNFNSHNMAIFSYFGNMAIFSYFGNMAEELVNVQVP